MFLSLSSLSGNQLLLEHQVVVVTLAWVLASIPLALLFFQVLFPGRAPEAPASPEHTPSREGDPPSTGAGKGVAFHYWKPVDGIVALWLIGLFGAQALSAHAPSAVETESAPLRLSTQFITGQIMFQLSMIALVLGYLGALRGLGISRIFGLRRLSPARSLWVGFVWIIAGGAVLLTLMDLLLRLLMNAGFSPPEQQQLVRALQAAPDARVAALTAVSVVVCAPLMEEILFRGLFYGVAKRFTHPAYAAVAVSVFFGAVHGNFLSLIPLTLLGLMFTMAYERTRSLLVPVVMHAFFNAGQMALIFYGKELEELLQRWSSAGG